MRMRTPSFKDESIDNCDYLINDSIDFDNDNKICLEIGMGKGDFIIGMALNNPNYNYIGMEMHSSVLSIAINKINDYDLNNIRIVRMDAKDSIDLLKDKVDTIYLNFSDPWPKNKHAKRRLTHEFYLKIYDELFKDKNCKKIIMKTDNDGLFEFSLKSFKEYGYEIEEISHDLHKENRFNVMTEYEKKFSNNGIKIKYVKVIKNN
ncbi:tRNA (guanosine(46)-N7)-methyltransferase TrmB [uncultured Methanobrevibacter sp.]|uniref:tRNA (guanosine(46)-N7)-methyltransferase TrmB n=1 Tax=uncultured Methanobrevibacter sp. TaxID=253161 RepID=UPI0025EDE479|nr:tRNA (guanosine(46)-N7)-methyltransferase TrmB [uncultured Methanobrevibacter sp.]